MARRNGQPPIHKKKRQRATSRTCNGKTRFRDKREADQALHLLEVHATREKIPGRSYRCPRCKGWHLTSMPSHPEME